ncbi:hypothetical protein MRS76_08700 [Rhizobiaceae bacterium n13]|uniref:Uncharacterized protein n=1 Tax=Ferirhizobium litorale TaxID=2927786 RepID=A0AAE3QES6_9HYPH|nr:hypothetical protein [Fererhizobium litorale]MDI7862033.1 hypothetical protein [Fererhizobium litorale]MDI7922695.1 hypothetical protein [Fererhizobium litorale]
MPKKRKCDDELRLMAEYPGVYGDLLAGRIQTLKQALRIVGLAPKRTRVEKLKASWAKASAGERDEFLQWLLVSGALPSAPTGTAASEGSVVPKTGEFPIASGRYLLPSTIARIKDIMVKRRLNADSVMEEMGFASGDRALARALLRNTSLRLAVIAALDRWLRANSEV